MLDVLCKKEIGGPLLGPGRDWDTHLPPAGFLPPSENWFEGYIYTGRGKRSSKRKFQSHLSSHFKFQNYLSERGESTRRRGRVRMAIVIRSMVEGHRQLLAAAPGNHEVIITGIRVRDAAAV